MSEESKHYKTNGRPSSNTNSDRDLKEKRGSQPDRLLNEDLYDQKSCKSMYFAGKNPDGSSLHDFNNYASGAESNCNEIFKNGFANLYSRSNGNSDGSDSGGSSKGKAKKKVSPKLVKPKYLKDVLNKELENKNRN